MNFFKKKKALWANIIVFPVEIVDEVKTSITRKKLKLTLRIQILFF